MIRHWMCAVEVLCSATEHLHIASWYSAAPQNTSIPYAGTLWRHTVPPRFTLVLSGAAAYFCIARRYFVAPQNTSEQHVGTLLRQRIPPRRELTRWFDSECGCEKSKKSVTDFTRLQTLVAPPRFELSQTEPKPGVLPLHHGAISFLRAQR